VIRVFREHKVEREKNFGELKPRTNADTIVLVFANERENNLSAMNNIMTTNCSPLNVPTVATLPF